MTTDDVDGLSRAEVFAALDLEEAAARALLKARLAEAEQ